MAGLPEGQAGCEEQEGGEVREEHDLTPFICKYLPEEKQKFAYYENLARDWISDQQFLMDFANRMNMRNKVFGFRITPYAGSVIMDFFLREVCSAITGYGGETGKKFLSDVFAIYDIASALFGKFYDTDSSNEKEWAKDVVDFSVEFKWYTGESIFNHLGSFIGCSHSCGRAIKLLKAEEAERKGEG